MAWYLFVRIPNNVTLIMRLVTLVSCHLLKYESCEKNGWHFWRHTHFLKYWNVKKPFRNARAHQHWNLFLFWQMTNRSTIYMGMERRRRSRKNGNCTSWKTDRKTFLLRLQSSETWHDIITTTWLLRPSLLSFQSRKIFLFPFVHANSCQNIHQSS